MKYKHHDIILAWLNGEEIEIRFSDKSNWIKVNPVESVNVLPFFSVNDQFRIKPKTKTVWYNLHSGGIDGYYGSKEEAEFGAKDSNSYIETRSVDIPDDVAL